MTSGLERALPLLGESPAECEGVLLYLWNDEFDVGKFDAANKLNKVVTANTLNATSKTFARLGMYCDANNHR